MIRQNPRLGRKYQRPGLGADRLYRANFIHPDLDRSCEVVGNTDASQGITRSERAADSGRYQQRLNDRAAV